jgi:hypothetical protein
MGDRIETGPLQCGDDWPGVFIRGDNALMGYAPALDRLLNGQDQFGFAKAEAESLLKLLRSCAGGRPDGLQRTYTEAEVKALVEAAYRAGLEDAAREGAGEIAAHGWSELAPFIRRRIAALPVPAGLLARLEGGA